METTKHYKGIFVFEPAICASSQKICFSSGRRHQKQQGTECQATFFPAPLYAQADLLRLVPICENPGYTKPMAKTQAVAAATATSKVRPAEAAKGIKRRRKLDSLIGL